MKGFVEFETEETVFAVAITAIVAVTQHGAEGCVITFSTTIPSISNDNAIYIPTTYGDVMAKIAAAS